jgi:hypothetical protein
VLLKDLPPERLQNGSETAGRILPASFCDTKRPAHIGANPGLVPHLTAIPAGALDPGGLKIGAGRSFPESVEIFYRAFLSFRNCP